MSAVYDMDQPLALAESILNHTFADKMLGLEALMMAGGPNGTPGLVRYGGEWRAVEKNDRLAVHGDRQLAANLSEAWYSTGQPKESETTLRNALTDNKTLKQRGARFGLDKCVMMEGGHGQREVSTRCMATTVEALVGAVHLDAGGGGAGYDAVRKVMEHLGFFDHEMLEGAQDVENVVMGGPVQSVA